jgi:hypothetical protein
MPLLVMCSESEALGKRRGRRLLRVVGGKSRGSAYASTRAMSWEGAVMTYVIAQFEIIQFVSLTPFRSYHTPYPLPTAPPYLICHPPAPSRDRPIIACTLFKDTDWKFADLMRTPNFQCDHIDCKYCSCIHPHSNAFERRMTQTPTLQYTHLSLQLK